MIYLLSALVLFLVVLRFKQKKRTIGFFHPYCNAGGGGERVLWCAINGMQKKWPEYSYLIYSGDVDASKEQILLKAKQRFGIEIDPKNVDFIFLRCRRLVEADLYPRFTLFFQSFFGFILGFEALLRFNPEIFIDSMGYALTLPLFKFIAGSKVLAYVHYPTISTDMIELVSRREMTYNNCEIIAQSGILSHAKLMYYRIFAFVYGLAGKTADYVMVNGTWTGQHIKRLWGNNPKVLFPPTDVSSFLLLEQTSESWLEKDNIVRILSIGQIRPEKNHKLQIEALAELQKLLDEDGNDLKAQLVIAGGCRGVEDEARALSLKTYAKELAVQDDVKLALNISFDELLEYLDKSLISIHTMFNEHFGISVVEGMAAGTIMVAHDSGGPQLDIVVSKDKKKPVGFLAQTKEEYARCMHHIVNLKRDERNKIRTSARKSVERFNSDVFAKEWNSVMEKFILY